MFKPYYRLFLKVKIKSLAEEARIIRREERKSANTLRNRLHEHRTHDVRRESRAALIAYGYLGGKSLFVIEQKAKRCLVIDRRAYSIVKKFGTSDAYKSFEMWLTV